MTTCVKVYFLSKNFQVFLKNAYFCRLKQKTPMAAINKTNAARLLVRGDRNGEFVCVIPGDMEVDLKVAARISGNKNCEMLKMKELLPATGYIRGGCSPIGMKKPFPTFIYESALLYPYIYISAGTRGLQIKIDPQALIDFVGAGIYPL